MLEPMSCVRISSASFQVCAYLFPFCIPWLFPYPFSLSLSLSLSLSFVRAHVLPCGCGPPRLIPSRALTWLVLFPTSFSCVACVVELGADADPLCSRAEVVGVEDVVVYPFSLRFPSPLFPLPYISPAFLSFPVSAIVLACHML